MTQEKLSFTVSPVPYEALLTPSALSFLSQLVERFAAKRNALLAAREDKQKQIDAGVFPDFLPDTRAVREGEWKVAPAPPPLRDRRVEITGPVDRKMIINGLNSGARVYMADFEDSQSPTWEGMMEGQVNLRDAVNRSITFTSPQGKKYALNDTVATLIVRPRGLHLEEKHVHYEDVPIPGAFFDFALYFFHNAKNALAKNSGPYFYLPKLESHQEAALWSEIFSFAETYLDLEKGTIKCTVLIETITAVFEMHEILYALKDYCVGLNCGRWDYIFSFIKKFQNHSNFILPDRSQVGMRVHFLSSYSKLLINTCHRRGAHAMGGMAAQIPIKHDVALNQAALAKVREDKLLEAENGHDGTWVAHPGLVAIAKEIFDAKMPQENQIDKPLSPLKITQADLLAVPKGTITAAGFRNNVQAALHYLVAWLSGNGCVPINFLMEDMATAEIARAQLWQWLRYQAKTVAGEPLTPAYFRTVLKEVKTELQQPGSPLTVSSALFEEGSQLLDQLVTQERCASFLTLAAYPLLPSFSRS